jgi:predicted nucleotidyltransferase/HEPN domain-containing protein
MEEFDKVTTRATQPRLHDGKVYKIILFGSYARDDWVDEPENGYQSDFDLLIVVSHKDLTEIADYWYVAEDRILRDPAIGRPVNIIVHSIDEVNQALKRGEYFWVDIARDGIALYELAGHPLAPPMPLTPSDAYRMAQKYFDQWFPGIKDLQAGAQLYKERGNRSLGAFTLHQAAERTYNSFLLVRSQYVPRSHNLKFLRSLAEDKEPRLIAAWPRATKIDRRRFELLKRAYVEARYSANYEISSVDLDALSKGVQHLRELVELSSREWLDHLRREAGP